MDFTKKYLLYDKFDDVISKVGLAEYEVFFDNSFEDECSEESFVSEPNLLKISALHCHHEEE